MKNTLDFIQQVLLNLGKTDLKPKHSRMGFMHSCTTSWT